MDDNTPKFEKFKQHLKNNKKVYLVGAGCLTIGAAGSFVLCGGPHQVKQAVDSFKLVHIQYKSPNVNIALVKNACPAPIPVHDKVTGEDYGSIRRAAKVTGETIHAIRKDVHGTQDRFVDLPESVFA